MIKKRSEEATDWAWAAGFFDGEGHISCRDRSGTGHLGKYRSPRTLTMAISQHHREVLDRFETITAGGKVYILTKTRPERSKLRGQYLSYSWRTGQRALILDILYNMWPYLGDIKKKQACEAIVLHTSLDPNKEQANPVFIEMWHQYYNDRAGDFDKEEK